MRINIIIGVIATLAVGSAAATQPTCTAAGTVGAAETNLETGHYYTVYSAPGIAWADAKAAVDALPEYLGVKGHLATITSQSEDSWVNALRQDAGLCTPEAWIGGVQPAGNGTGLGWAWDNGEGPIGTSNEPRPSYSNWLPNEPNDNTGPGSENYLAIGLNGQFGWNDEGALGNIGGYVVEYDVPRPAACDPLSGDCQTIKGQSLVFPAGSFDTNTTVPFNGFEFTDPRVAAGTCGEVGLTLFGDDYGKPELRIPPYLCGSPRFVVVAVNGDQLDIQSGTVAIENDTSVVLPDNTVKICKDTVGPTTIQRPQFGDDPQQDDVVVYQTTDPLRMREDYSNTGVDPQFVPGAAGEFTNACGSSRGTSKEASYFVVGMHIDFGTTDPATVSERFVALTLYKLSLLQKSVTAARAAGVLKNGDTTKMTAQLNNAVKKLGRGDPSGALGHVQQFLKFVDAAKYSTPAPVSGYPPDSRNNFNGEHLMRGRNVEFTLRVKIIPQAP